MRPATAPLRQEILDLLEKRLSDFKQGYRQNIAILGDESLGKTTLLKQFMGRIDGESIAPAYVDIAPFELSLFFRRTLNNLLYNYLKGSQLLSTRENLELLNQRTKITLPLTATLIDRFLAAIDKEKPESLFKDLFAIFEAFTQETRRSCLLIFDEFHNLKSLGIKGVFHELGKKIMFQKNILFVFSSSMKIEAKSIIANDLSLLFGNFETIELQPLTSSRAADLIQAALAPAAAPKELADFLIHFTGGQPFYLKRICEEAALLCRAGQKDRLDKGILIETLERLLFEEGGAFHTKFSSVLSQLSSNRAKNDFLYLLDAIAVGTRRLKDLAHAARKQKAEVLLKLNKLIELNLVSKNGSFYALTDRLMAFWLKFVHFEKLFTLSPDCADQLAHFRANVDADIEAFIATSRQPIADRMIDLFNQFEEDDIQFDRKKYRLSHFKELKVMTFDDSGLKIGLFGKTQDSLWLAAVKEDGLDEKDVNAFLSTTKKYKHKCVNKILVSLGGIDRNARLLAKESSVITWDIANINELFDFYGKPRIIK